MQDSASRRALFSCSQPRSAFQEVMTSIGEQDNNISRLRCTSGHNFLKVYGRMSSALFNVFTSNYAAELNSAIHSGKSGMGSSVATRKQGQDKVKKLNSAKK